MKKIKFALAVLLLSGVSACDYSGKKDLRLERRDAGYQAAMADYQAGRIEAAIRGFEKVVADDPTNASARFQLACLLQDAKRDYLAAYCGFREYLAQQPKSDRANPAKERMRNCEREVVRLFAERSGASGSEVLTKEIESLKAQLKKTETQLADRQRELDELKRKHQDLTAERQRLLGMMHEKPETTEPKKIVSDDIKSLLDNEEEPVANSQLQADLKLVREMEGEESMATPLPKATRPAPVPKPQPKETKQIPDTYVVENGDTLYKIAERFYGRSSAWRKIREANKAIISTDGRVKTGDKIVLPHE